MEFALPIRVRWDIDSLDATGPVDRIADRIREIEPLFVELSVHGPAGLRHLPALLDAFGGGFTQRLLALGPFPGAAEAAAASAGVERLWRIAGPSDLDGLPAGVSEASFVPDAGAIDLLPAVLEAVAGSRAAVLHLPNINAVRASAQGLTVPIPTPAQYAALERRLSASPIPLAGKRLVVHDYFLWRVLARLHPESLGERLEFGGCQAGSALAYVDPAGVLYPCDSLPIPLGNLAGDRSFQQIWDSAARVGAVDAIGKMPEPCLRCEVLPACRAGCRGMSLLSAGTLDAPDPACPGPARPR